MKKLLIMILMTLIGVIAFAQSDGAVVTRQPSNNDFADILRDMPDVRILNSGSKILVEYQGEWPEDMKGAFEYAAKIWEENIPMCVPIKITAKIEDFGGADELSSVQCFTFFDRAINNAIGGVDNICPSSVIKAQTLIDYNRYGKEHLIYDDLGKELGEMLTRTDMEISYNADKIAEFSFALDAETVPDKYDFVTLSMRNIAIGLGLGNRIMANPSEQKILFNNNSHTPFEKRILNNIGWTDASDAYIKATEGSLNIGNGMILYAPSPFQNGISLRSTVPSGSNPINHLLAHDFSKGYVMRNIANYNWNSFFSEMLNWDLGIIVGSVGATVEQSLDYESTLPYSGTVSLSNLLKSTNHRSRNANHVLQSEDIEDQDTTHVSINIEEFLRKYCLATDSEYDSFRPRYVLSVQLNDGSWDPVKSQLVDSGDFTIDFNQPLPKPESEYARSTTGKLKYRIVEKAMEKDGSLFFGKYTKPRYLDVQYFTREFTPQTPVIAYTGEIIEPETATYSEQDYYDDYVDVKIKVSNIEGATQMAIDQLDEGETETFTYEADDFRKGYVVATLDPNLSSTITLLAVNKNGMRQSNPISIPALNSQERNISFNVKKDRIAILGLGDGETQSGRISYALISPLSSTKIEEGKVHCDRNIDISTLSSGFYILTLEKNGKVIGSTRFVR